MMFERAAMVQLKSLDHYHTVLAGCECRLDAKLDISRGSRSRDSRPMSQMYEGDCFARTTSTYTAGVPQEQLLYLNPTSFKPLRIYLSSVMISWAWRRISFTQLVA